MVGGKCISIGYVQAKIGDEGCALLLVVHALGGCDTTSAIFGFGKGTIFNRITEDIALHDPCMMASCI